MQHKYTDHNNKRFFVWLDGIVYFKLTKWVCREWSDRTVDEIKGSISVLAILMLPSLGSYSSKRALIEL